MNKPFNLDGEMKKAELTLALLLATVSVTAGLKVAALANANPNPIFPYFPNTPVNTQPIINIESPKQNQSLSGALTLNLTLIKPLSWFGKTPTEWPFDNVNITFYYSVVRVRAFYYLLDNESSEIFPVKDSNREMEVPVENFTFSQRLNVKEGNHNLTVYFNCQSFYYPQGSKVWEVASYINFTGASETVFFNVDNTAPVISILTETAKQSFIEFPLDFVINENVSKISCVLDGQSNFTITGNITMPNLGNGYHNVTIYATDLAGNVGSSETLTFTVDKPEPLPIMPIAASIGIIAIMSACSLVYFKKHKERKQS